MLDVDAQFKRRRKAVQARLSGASLRAAAREAGVSVPTALKAWRAFERDGWEGLRGARRGRPSGSDPRRDPAWTALQQALLQEPSEHEYWPGLWSAQQCERWLRQHGWPIPQRSLLRKLSEWGLSGLGQRRWRELDPSWRRQTLPALQARLRRTQGELHLLEEAALPASWPTTSKRGGLLRAIDARGHAQWLCWHGNLRAPLLIDFIDRLRGGRTRPLGLLLSATWQRAAALADWLREQPELLSLHLPAAAVSQRAAPTPRRPLPSPRPALVATATTPSPAFQHLLNQFLANTPRTSDPYAAIPVQPRSATMSLNHLARLEAEAIHIFREVQAEAERPVLLYSIGKDSAVLLHLALKAFYPARLPMPLLHVDTGWKFRAMYAHRDRIVRGAELDLIVHTNAEGVARGINPFDHGANLHTDIMKTQALKQALDRHGFDVAFGGARRDEEKSRAKERVLSLRNAQHRWDPKTQRPELWRLYNGRKRKGESLRAFPLSNWTEADIWQYIRREGIELVPLYFAAERPVVERDGVLIMVDDERMPLHAGEVPVLRKVRFRTLGCYPLTGAVPSEASDLDAVIAETLASRSSERSGRVIDHDLSASMEKKKQEGYF
jgi:sulfate adenylyltransferase subunit 2